MYIIFWFITRRHVRNNKVSLLVFFLILKCIFLFTYILVYLQGLLSHGTQLLYTYFHSGPPKLMLLLPQENDLAKTVAAYAGLKQWGALQVRKLAQILNKVRNVCIIRVFHIIS